MRTMYAVAIGLAVFGLSAPARADETAPAPSPAVRAAAPARPRLTAQRAVAEILDAPDPSAAVEAYSRAKAVTTQGGIVEQAYVRRMAEAGLPEMAEVQAKHVLDVDLAEPLSTAVVAAMRAKRGDAEGAITSIATAVAFGSDEPFVRRTAGQILAWHDTRSGTMADDIETSLETMRHTVGETPECAEAYERARDAYLAARATTAQPAQSGATLVADSVEAEFAGDADSDAVIFTSAAASCGVWWNYVAPSCRAAWCLAVVRACSVRAFDYGRSGTRFAAQRVSWGRTGVYGRSYASWSTPLGTFSRTVRTGPAYYVPAARCAPAPSCPPQRCDR